MRLSVLICHVDSRREDLAKLMAVLLPQIGEMALQESRAANCLVKRYVGQEVEVVVISDQGQIKVGRKRNMLKRHATGTYFSFVDDDDMVAKDYVALILKASETSPDVIVFDAIMYHDGKKRFDVKYGIEYARDFNSDREALRLPNHLMAVKRSLVMNTHFPEAQFGEDSAWALRIKPLLKIQARIEKVLYWYYFSPQTTLAQARHFRPHEKRR